MRVTKVRDYSKRGDALPIPNLIEVQSAAYERFLQRGKDYDEREKGMGLESLLGEVFPIESYDGSMKLEYLYYKLDEARYTPDECRELRLTYGMPFRIGVRLVRKDVQEMPEEEIYLGEIPIMMGGGEFIVNGAERVIVNQLHRSPGVDFAVASSESDRPLHSARIIPERGSWIEIEVTKKDVLAMRIDQSTKIAATTFLRAIDEKYSTTAALLGRFYDVEELPVGQIKPEHYAAAPIIDTDTGEELIAAGHQIGEAIGKVQGSNLAKSSGGGTLRPLRDKFAEVMKAIKSDNWENGLPAAPAGRGVYLFRNRSTKSRPIEYVGIADKNLGKRLGDHWSSNVFGSGLRWTIWKKKIKAAGDDRTKPEEVKGDTDAEGAVTQWMKDNLECIAVPVEFSDHEWGAFEDAMKQELVPKKDEKTKSKNVLGFLEDRLWVEFKPSLNKEEPEDTPKKIKSVWSGGERSTGTISVIANVSDPLILNTIAAEQSDGNGGDHSEHEAALLRLYGRLRPGNPPQVEKARQLFNEKFFDENRYRLGRVGRFRVNRKFGLESDESEMKLTADDFLETLGYLLDLRSNRNNAHTDDIDHLGNRRLRTLDELAVEELRKGFLKLRRTVQERMTSKDPDELAKVADLINSKAISSSIDFFFGRGELSQVVDQTNPLSMLTHERRLSALGPGGLNRKRAGFEVRDVHISHYGRICPIETPEGTNIGLIASLGIYSKIDEYGFLLTPYQAVKRGKTNGEHTYLRADEEMRAVLAPADVLDDKGRVRDGNVLARVNGELSQVDGDDVAHIDISPKQIVGVSAALIPFLEHDDANRALMGSNMQRQAVPLVNTQPPVVATGMEKEVPKNSGMVVRARNAGTVTSIDARHIVIDNADEYDLRKFVGLNEKTCLNQKPIVRLGQKVREDQIIADGAATTEGELALGANVMVAFNTFDGYNFEDAIVINERLVKDDVFTSIHIEEFDVEIRETKLGREEFTRDIPNVSEKQLANLDDYGVIQIGSHVNPRDILVGKVSPKSKSELTPEEKLLHAIFGRAGEDVKNDSLEVPAGTSGVVIAAKRFSRRMHMSDDQKKQLRRDMREYESSMNDRAIALFRQMVDQINEVIGTPMIDPSTRQKVGASEIGEIILEQIDNFKIKWVKGSKEARQQAEQVYRQFWPRIEGLMAERDRKLAHMKRGDELPSGVLEMVKVYLATRRQLAVGDKMAGRHGNKGVIARIVPEADMPFLDDGTAVDVLLNPLGVPSRMNVGQILETHLGWACKVLGFQAVTPVFDGATETEVHQAIEDANEHVRTRVKELAEAGEAPNPLEILSEMPPGGKVQLYDGRTGEPFDQRTTVGQMYLLKLHHLVDDKIHARATGPYSLITQQPLGGKARTGGQRFGEMEVWALEAYGAAHVLQELLTVKSDDVEGRTTIYESMVKGNNTLEAGMPVAFDVLCNEIKGLGLNVTLEKKQLEGGSLL